MAIMKNRVTVLLGIMLAMALFVSPRPVFSPDLGQDRASYLAHTMTVGMDFDLDYENEPYDSAFFNAVTGMPSHPLGPGLLAAPFVAAFALVDRVFDHPVLSDHRQYFGSWSSIGFVFAGVFYFFAGIWFYIDLAKRLAPSLHPGWIVLFAMGSGVAYYVFQDGFLAPPFQFFGFALVVWSSARAWETLGSRLRGWPFFIAGALGVMLVHLIRPADLNVVALPLLVGFVFSLGFEPNSAKQSLVNFLGRYAVTLVLTFAVLGSFYSHVYHSPFPRPADMYGSSAPLTEVSAVSETGSSGLASLIATVAGRVDYIPAILGSSEFGLLYTAPVMVVGVVLLFGYILAYLRVAPLRSGMALLLMLGFIALPVAVVLYWQTTASMYGWRYLFAILALGFLGLIVSHEWLRSDSRTRLGYRLVFGALIALSVVGSLSQIFWGTSERLHFHAGKNIFGITHANPDGHCCSGYGYLTKLAEDLPKVSTWVNMAAHRMPGFAAAVALDKSGGNISVVGASLGIPADKLSAGVGRYAGVSGRMIAQVLMLYLFSVAAVWFLGRKPRVGTGSTVNVQ
jgi:hypothetical protein